MVPRLARTVVALLVVSTVFALRGAGAPGNAGDPPDAVKVPSLLGMSAREAKAALAAAGLVAKFQLGSQPTATAKPRIVYDQDPPADTLLSTGSAVRVTIYSDPPDAGEHEPASATATGLVEVPRLIGQSTREAKAAVLEVGLLPKFQVGAAAPTAEKALTVYTQDPRPGSGLAPGSPVRITVYARAALDVASPPPGAGPTELSRVEAFPWPDQAAEVIDPSSGQLLLSATDLIVPAGPVTLEVRRSLLTQPDRPGLLGARWRMNWEPRLFRSGPQAVIHDDSREVVFKLDEATKRYRSPAGEVLVFQADRAVRTSPDGSRETYDDRARLIEREDPRGNKTVLAYDADGRLSRIDGPFDVSLRLVTDADGRLTRIESSTGATVRYAYGTEAPAEPLDGGMSVDYAYDAGGLLVRIDLPHLRSTQFTYDAQGRVTSRHWADGTGEHYERDDAAGTLRYIDAAGNLAVTRWDLGGRRAELTNPLGHKTTIEYDAQGRPLAVVGPTGLEAHFAYDALGRTVRVEDPVAGTWQFEYLGDGALPSAILDPHDDRQSFDYDERHNLLSVTSSADRQRNATFEYYPNGLVKTAATGDGTRWSFTYDAAGRRASATDAAGGTWTFEYDAQGNLAREIDPLGGTTAWTYDAQGRTASLTEASGAVTRYEYADGDGSSSVTVIGPTGGVYRFVYDRRGRLAEETDPAGRTTRYHYDPVGRLESVTDAAGQSYRFEYDPGGNLIAATNPAGAVTARTYDPLGQVTSHKDVAGAIASYEYAPGGLLSKEVDGAGIATRFDYDPQGRLTAATDAAERATQYEYAASGRLARIVPSSGPALLYQYDDYGRVARILRGDEVVVAYEYDALGRRTGQRQSNGLEIAYRYDALGNLLAWQDNLGSGGTFQYDGAGRPIAATDALGATTQYRYDPAGNLLETSDPLGNVERLAYNAAGDLIEAASPTGDQARYEYDPAGRVSTIRHPGGGKSSIAYGPLGNPVQAVDPLGHETRSAYDGAGRLVGATDAKGQTTTFDYDDAGRLLRKVLADGKIVAYRYDELGRPIAVDDGAYPVRYAYDEEGNLASIEYPAIRRTLRYEYNEAGQRTRFVDSEGQSLRYEYDAADRLTAMRFADDQAVLFVYDAAGRLTQVAYPNGVTGAWRYDAADRPVKLTYTDDSGQTVAEWSDSYDAAGNRLETVDAEGRAVRYGYDATGQLIEEDAGDGQAAKYTYLPGGDRGTREQHGETVRYRYDAANRLLAAGRETLTYDANGNVIERRDENGLTRYVYDTQDQLVQVVLPDGAEVRYGYSPTGERVWRRDAQGIAHFVTDGVNLLAELGDDLRPKATYVHGPGVDRPLAMSRADRRYFFHADRLGSIRRVTDRQGAVAAGYDYDAFGQVRARTGELESPFTFTARELDPATGLYYYRARYYDARLGRFLSVDTAAARPEDPLTLNPYLYARNSPARFTDPFGLDPYDPDAFPARIATNPSPSEQLAEMDYYIESLRNPAHEAHAREMETEWGWAKMARQYREDIQTKIDEAFLKRQQLLRRLSGRGNGPSSTGVAQTGQPGTTGGASGPEPAPTVAAPTVKAPRPPGNLLQGGQSSFAPPEPVPDMGPLRRVTGAGGTLLVGADAVAGLAEGKSPAEVAQETAGNLVKGTVLGTVAVKAAMLAGGAVGGFFGGPPGAVAGAEFSGGLAAGALLGWGAMGAGKRLGAAFGERAADEPIEPVDAGNPDLIRIPDTDRGPSEGRLGGLPEEDFPAEDFPEPASFPTLLEAALDDYDSVVRSRAKRLADRLAATEREGSDRDRAVAIDQQLTQREIAARAARATALAEYNRRRAAAAAAAAAGAGAGEPTGGGEGGDDSGSDNAYNEYLQQMIEIYRRYGD